MSLSDNRTVLRLAFWGIPLSLAVLGLKLLAWWLTGSVALLSDGLESTVNVIAAVIAYLMIGYAAKPADAGHPFGHHKAEYFSAVIEGVLIVVAALLIVWEAVPAMMAPVMLEAPALGLAIDFAARCRQRHLGLCADQRRSEASLAGSQRRRPSYSV